MLPIPLITNLEKNKHKTQSHKTLNNLVQPPPNILCLASEHPSLQSQERQYWLFKWWCPPMKSCPCYIPDPAQSILQQNMGWISFREAWILHKEIMLLVMSYTDFRATYHKAKISCYFKPTSDWASNSYRITALKILSSSTFDLSSEDFSRHQRCFSYSLSANTLDTVKMLRTDWY